MAVKGEQNYVVPGKTSIPIATFFGVDETPYEAFKREWKHNFGGGLKIREKDLELLGITYGRGQNPMLTMRAPIIKRKKKSESKRIISGKPHEIGIWCDSGKVSANAREALGLYLGRMEGNEQEKTLAALVKSMCLELSESQ